jgi:hypothetical protein
VLGSPWLVGVNLRTQTDDKQEVLGRTNLPTFPTCHLFEVLEPTLMEPKLSELTLTSLNSI